MLLGSHTFLAVAFSDRPIYVNLSLSTFSSLLVPLSVLGRKKALLSGLMAIPTNGEGITAEATAASTHVSNASVVQELIPGPNGNVDEMKQDSSVASILLFLTSMSHLDRERALRRLEESLNGYEEPDLAILKSTLLSRLVEDHPWQTVHASVAACTALITHIYSVCPGRLADGGEMEFIKALQNIAGKLVTNTEPRVREATSVLIGALSQASPLSTFLALTPVLLSHADANFSLDAQQRLKEASRIAARDVKDVAAAAAKSGHSLVHETEGWRGLETTLLALGALVKGSGSVAASCTDGAFEDILTCIDRARPHPNRFVREAGLILLNACALSAAFVSPDLVDPTVSKVAKACLPSLQEGLQDNWSQVRYVASVATRTILSNLTRDAREPFYDVLLPRMCLNRHYVAEGVRNYSQETWRSVLGTDGRRLLKERLHFVIDFYVSQTGAENHAVREAACQSLGEAVLRLETSSVANEVGRVISALVDCFKDESWPVRDHACRALSEVVCAFPVQAEAKNDLMEVRELFVRHLSDNIPSVRVNCAQAFVRACAAYSDDHPFMGFKTAAKIAEEQMIGIESQREDIQENGAKDSNGHNTVVLDTQFGASTRLAGAKHSGNSAHDRAHTDQVMYSCGSLAPKLRRGGGCSDHGFVRPKEGWEMSEGGILVWRALLQSGPRGRAHADALFLKVVQVGLIGVQKSFRQQSKFILAVLSALNDALQIRIPVATDTISHIVAIIAASEGQSDVNRRAGRECRRHLVRSVGLSAVSEAERAIVRG